MPWSSQTITTTNIRLHVTRTGDAQPAFVALHGRAANGRLWTSTARLLEAHYNVIMPDLRGHGLSAAPADGYDHNTLAHDILGVMDALGVEQAVLLGSSMGAAVATRIAAQHPTRVIKLILHLTCWTSNQQLAPVYLRRKLARKHAQFRTWNTMPLPELEAQVRMFSAGWADEDITLATQAWRHTHPNVAQTFAHDLTEVDWQALVKQVQCPILALFGHQEPGFDTIRIFCENELPNCTFAPLKGGHTAMYGDFETYTRYLQKFLALTTF